MNCSATHRVAGVVCALLSVGTTSRAQPAPPAEIVAPAGAGPTFGRSVAVDGTTLVVGAPGESTAAAGAGAAYVYELRPSGWTLVARLAPDALLAGDEFGHAVALDAATIVVGAPGDDVVRNAAGAIVSTVPNKGAAYVFERSGGAWSLAARLDHASAASPYAEPTAEDRFGLAVAADDAVVMVGAPGFDGPSGWVLHAIDQGAVAVFERPASTWELATWLTLTALGRASPNGLFGQSIAMQDGAAIAAAPGSGPGGGHVFTVERSTTSLAGWFATSALPVWASDGVLPVDSWLELEP